MPSVQGGCKKIWTRRLTLQARHVLGACHVLAEDMTCSGCWLQDTSWLDVYLSDIPHVVYHNADPRDTQGAQHRTLANKGNEAMGYLQFIVDYYDRLPASIAFIHGHRCAPGAARQPVTLQGARRLAIH